jgi:hypothetical protein
LSSQFCFLGCFNLLFVFVDTQRLFVFGCARRAEWPVRFCCSEMRQKRADSTMRFSFFFYFFFVFFLLSQVLDFGLDEKDAKVENLTLCLFFLFKCISQVDSAMLLHAAHNLVDAMKMAGRNAPIIDVRRAQKILADLELAYLQQVKKETQITHLKQILHCTTRLASMLARVFGVCCLCANRPTRSSTPRGGKKPSLQ